MYFARYRKMNKRPAPRSGGLLPDDGLALDMSGTRKPSPLANGSGTPNLPPLIARGTDPVSYEIVRKTVKMEGGSSSVPGSPPDV